jgi:energy-coupling factor transporter ATP-binding protein EcfA2
MSDLKLVRIEIDGFRKFQRPFVLDLKSPAGDPLDYLVLAGPNGCGKTTILEAILLALRRDGMVVGEPYPADPRDASQVWLPDHARLQLTLLQSGTGVSFTLVRSQFGWHQDVRQGGHGFYPWSVVASEVKQLPVFYASARRASALGGPVQDTPHGESVPATEVNRIWTFKDRLRKQQGRRVAGYRGPAPRDELWLQQLNSYWRTFRDDGTTFAMTLVEPENLDRNDWDLFLYRGDERVCSIDAMSSGEQEVLALAMPFITEPFDGLLLIDEPEQHLHPQWQGRVLRAIRTLVPTSQMIVATHADDPWDDAMSWERRLLVDPDDPRAKSDAGDAR